MHKIPSITCDYKCTESIKLQLLIDSKSIITADTKTSAQTNNSSTTEMGANLANYLTMKVISKQI